MRHTTPASPGDEGNPFDSDNEEAFVSLEDELFGTIEAGDSHRLSFLLQEGAVQPNWRRESDGATALHVAAAKGNAAMCAMLLGFGSSVADKDTAECTPLDLAAEAGHLQAVRVLAKARHAGAKGGVLVAGAAAAATFAEDECYSAILDYIEDSIEKGKEDASIRALMVQQAMRAAAIRNSVGALVTAQRYAEQAGVEVSTPATQALEYAVEYRHKDICEYLVREAGADIEATNPNGYTPMAQAAECGYMGMMSKLVQLDAKPQGGAGLKSPLRAAVRWGDPSMVLFLLKHGAYDEPSEEGKTCLMEAARTGSMEMVQAILYKSQRMTRVDPKGRSVLHYALQAKVDSVPAANTVQALLDANADPGIRDKNGFLPVHYACYYDGVAPLVVLAKAGVDIEARVEGLQISCFAGQEEHQTRELKQVAPLQGCLPVHLAARNGKSNVVKHLLGLSKEGPDVRDVQGRSVLWHAVQVADNQDMVLLLLKGGARIEEEMPAISPLHQALTYQDEPVYGEILMEWKHKWGLKYTTHTHTLYEDTKAKEDEERRRQEASDRGDALLESSRSNEEEEEIEKAPFDGLRAQTGAAGFHTLRDPARLAKVTEYVPREPRHPDPAIDKAIAGYSRLSSTDDDDVRRRPAVHKQR